LYSRFSILHIEIDKIYTISRKKQNYYLIGGLVGGLYSGKRKRYSMASKTASTKKKKRVFRLLDTEDVDKALVGKVVYTLWPDNGQWYRGKVVKCHVKEMKALLFYKETNEKEEADLEELIGEGQIAFCTCVLEAFGLYYMVCHDMCVFVAEMRDVGHVCGENEIEQGPHNVHHEVGEGKDGEDEDDVGSDEEYRQEEGMSGDDSDSFDDDDDDDDTTKKRHRSITSRTRDQDDPLLVSTRGRKRKMRKHEDYLDEDELGDELPLSMRRKESSVKTATHDDGDAEEEDDEFAERILESARASKSVQNNRKAGVSQDVRVVRDKVKSAIRQGLDMALAELTKGGDGAQCQDPADVSSAVEEALYQVYGGATKEYKTKMRSLHFNLKDPNNKELRAHVLRGDISPDNFVRMTANELASKELAEYRKRKEEEALKMSVLDAEAAAKFSTAAALEIKDVAGKKEVVGGERSVAALLDDTTRNDVDVLKDTTGDAVLPETTTTAAQTGVAEEGKGTPSPNKAAVKHVENVPDEEPVTTRPASGLDWASIKSASVQASKVQQEDYIAGMEVLEEENDVVHDAGQATPDKNLTSLFLKCPEPLALGPDSWKGSVSVPGVGNATLSLGALSGLGDMEYLLGNGLSARGRLSLASLDKFLSELHLSKHRTASIGVLRSAGGKPKTVDEVDITALVSHYKNKDRAGVATSSTGVEVYLIPPGELSTKLLLAAQYLDGEIFSQCVPNLEDENMFVAVAVHKKEMAAKKRDSKAPVLLPEGLDLSAISALAAAVGVGEPAAHPPPEIKPMVPASSSTLPPALDLAGISALAQAFGIPDKPPPMTSAGHQGASAPKPMHRAHPSDPRRQ
jgi:hypothetical protein